MAEAHNAVAFQFVVTSEGVRCNLDRELLKLMGRTVLKSVKRRCNSAKNTFLMGVYPASPATWMFVLAALLAARYSEHSTTIDILDNMENKFPEKHRFDRSTVLAICIFTVVTLIWLFSAFFCQFLLRKLLGRWDLMKNFRKRKIGLQDKLWLGMVRLLSGFNPGLFSLQNSLPKLSVPALADTLKRHLDSVKPFMSEDEYNQVVEQTDDFQNGVGPKLQRYLVLKSLWSPNYVSDWWERFVYLRSRASLMINSNYYGVGSLYAPLTKIQSARAANMIYACFRYRRLIDQHRLTPLRLAGTYPLCSAQYINQFNSCRIPGKEEDQIVRINDTFHVVIYHKGRFFKMNCYFSGDLLKPADLQAKINKILDNDSMPIEGEDILPILTASDRPTWAEAREKHFLSNSTNKESLDCIEQAAFFVVLEDDSDYWSYEESSQDDINAFSKRMLHGKGYDRWFDKSFNLIICKNGQVGFNAEHTWGDAPVMAQIWEWTMVEDIENLPYDENGNCSGKPRFNWPIPSRLKFDFPEELIVTMKACVPRAVEQINDVDLYTKIHTRFGKGDIKKMKVSPDAFIQVAFQLAYYKSFGKVCLTYESAMTRLFREGRTETVRSCSIASTEFARVADDPNVSDDEKRRLMIAACEYHIYTCQMAMTGEGIDRHLFSLYVVSQYLQLDVPFLKTYLSEKWTLSTSQTAVNQTMRLNLDKFPDRACAGGGFGPVDANGYGISYIICGENLISFHVSCKNSCSHTNSEKFANLIEESMWQMRGYMMDEEGNLKK